MKNLHNFFKHYNNVWAHQGTMTMGNQPHHHPSGLEGTKFLSIESSNALNYFPQVRPASVQWEPPKLNTPSSSRLTTLYWERGFFPASSREGKSLQVLWRGLAWYAHWVNHIAGEVPCGRHYCSSVLPPLLVTVSDFLWRLILSSFSTFLLGLAISKPHLL